MFVGLVSAHGSYGYFTPEALENAAPLCLALRSRCAAAGAAGTAGSRKTLTLVNLWDYPLVN